MTPKFVMDKEFKGKFGELIRDPNLSSPKLDNSIIYKYRSWQNKFHCELLLKSSIYMASAKEFKDKDDLKFNLRYDLLNAYDWEKRGCIILERQGYSKKVARRMAILKVPEMIQKCSDSAWLEKKNLEFRNDAYSKFGIFCCTNKPDSIEMWKEYGDEFNGFCIGLYPQIVCNAGTGIFPVLYYTNYPVIKPSPMDDSSDILACILLKKKELEYEQEYRVWTHKAVNGNLNLPTNAFKEIIIGYRMSEEHRNEIFSLKKIYSEVTFYEAKYDDITSKVEIIKLEI